MTSGGRIGAAVFALGLVAAPDPARAAFVLTIAQNGNDVVVTGSGTLDLSGLFLFGAEWSKLVGIQPSSGYINTSSGDLDVYVGISGPASFGTGGNVVASAPGGIFGMQASSGAVAVPVGYVSGNPLTASLTFTNSTIASLGLTPGTFTYAWSSISSEDSITVTIVAGDDVVGTVPEPASLLLFGAGLLGLRLVRRRPG